MTALRWILNEAKNLKKKYPKRFKTWKEYVSQASAIYASKHKGTSPVGKKRKVGATLLLERGETARSPKRVMFRERRKDGTFKGIRRNKIGVSLLLERGETGRTVPRVYRIFRNSKGEFKGTKKISGFKQVFKVTEKEGKKKKHVYFNRKDQAIEYAKKQADAGKLVHVYEI